MCGRITLTVDPSVVQMQFDLASVPPFSPRYNIAPTQSVLALTNESRRDATLLRWGLIPSWAKDSKIGNRMINARSETLADKPSFRSAFRRRRCVIFADGFYEWQQRPGDGPKVPLYIRVNDGQPFPLAGLWEVWQPPEGDEPLRTCTIITTTPNDFMQSIHNRMPVILTREDMEMWLSPDEIEPDLLQPLLKAYDSAALSAYAVSREVNSPTNDHPGIIEPVPDQAGLL